VLGSFGQLSQQVLLAVNVLVNVLSVLLNPVELVNDDIEHLVNLLIVFPELAQTLLLKGRQVSFLPLGWLHALQEHAVRCAFPLLHEELAFNVDLLADF
jgi:hypothetical protein